jgi:[CysO sulfur-carrier protein]-S-L-cysteine hydrolase
LSTPFQLIIPRDIYDDMIAQARSELPNECCGFLAGQVQEPDIGKGKSIRVAQRFALVNSAPRPTKEYLSEGSSLIQAEKERRRLGLEFVAVYHSHPTSPPVPSQKDLKENYYGPHMMNFIISLQDGDPQVRAWWLEQSSFREADWRLVD